jgi:hypothetical protein
MNGGASRMKGLKWSVLTKAARAVEHALKYLQRLVLSCMYILANRIKSDAFGPKRRISPFTSGKIAEVVTMLVHNPYYSNDRVYSAIIELLRETEAGIWAGKTEEELKLAFDIRLAVILNGDDDDDEPQVYCCYCGTELHEPYFVSKGGLTYCDATCAHYFTES